MLQEGASSVTVCLLALPCFYSFWSQCQPSNPPGQERGRGGSLLGPLPQCLALLFLPATAPAFGHVERE